MMPGTKVIVNIRIKALSHLGLAAARRKKDVFLIESMQLPSDVCQTMANITFEDVWSIARAMCPVAKTTRKVGTHSGRTVAYRTPFLMHTAPCQALHAGLGGI